jgi:multidrug resistance efflux pump
MKLHLSRILAHLKLKRWRYAPIAAVLVLIGGYAYAGQNSNLGATLIVTTADFTEQVSVSGTVTAAKDVALGFAGSGRIAGVYAQVGQHVYAGAILAETENGDLVATIAQKEAARASLLEGTRPEKLAVAEAAVASAASALINAVQNAYTTSDDAVHNRADALFTNPRTFPKLSFTVANTMLQAKVENDRVATEPLLTKWGSQVGTLTTSSAVTAAKQAQEYMTQIVTLLADANAALNQAVPDQSASSATLATYSTTVAIARANVNAAAATLTNALSALTEAERALALERTGATASDIAAATAEVQNARALLAKTRVVAPFSGIITRMDAKVGEVASPSASGISMQSDGLFQIETFVPEVAIARVVKGNPATTTLDAYGSSVTFRSVVVAVDPAETVKDGVPTYKTTLAFLAGDARIRSGMTANVVMQTGMLHDAIVIPSGAIGTHAGVLYVSVVTGGEVENRTVTTGPSPALGQAHILSGLAAGDVILLTPVP